MLPSVNEELHDTTGNSLRTSQPRWHRSKQALEEKIHEARRSFALLCIADIFLVGLMWTIYVSIIKMNKTFKKAFLDELTEYTIETSLVDIVLLSVVRSLCLIIIYLILKVKSWIPTAVSATGSSVFLLAKVVKFNMASDGQPITYLIVLSSFGMAWVGTYILDFKLFRKSLVAPDDNDFSCPEERSEDEEAPLLLYPNSRKVAPTARHRRSFSPSKRKLTQCDTMSLNTFHSALLSVPQSAEPTVVAEENRRNMLEIDEDETIDAFEKEAILKAHGAYEIGMKLLELDEGWKLQECGEYGTSLFTTDLDDIGKVFRLDVIVDESPDQVANLILDYELQASWNEAVEDVCLVQKITDNTEIYRAVTSDIIKGLISKREFINATKVGRSVGEFFSFGASVDIPNLPLKKGIIRGENKIAGFRVKGLHAEESSRSEFTHFLSVDIKGWVPQYMVEKATIKSLLAMAQALQRAGPRLIREARVNLSLADQTTDWAQTSANHLVRMVKDKSEPSKHDIQQKSRNNTCLENSKDTRAKPKKNDAKNRPINDIQGVPIQNKNDKCPQAGPISNDTLENPINSDTQAVPINNAPQAIQICDVTQAIPINNDTQTISIKNVTQSIPIYNNPSKDPTRDRSVSQRSDADHALPQIIIGRNDEGVAAKPRKQDWQDSETTCIEELNKIEVVHVDVHATAEQ